MQKSVRPWKGLDIAAEGSGISEHLSSSINLLGSLLGNAIEKHKGPEMLALVERLRLLCKQARDRDDHASREEVLSTLKQAELSTLTWLLRSFTVFFHLINKAEQLEISRINRYRAMQSSALHPRTESIAEAIAYVHHMGASADEVRSLINSLSIEPTLTAHPTEARRRSILYKQQHIAHQLKRLQREQLTPTEIERLYADMFHLIQLMLGTDEIRSESMSVKDEVQHGLYFCKTTLWEVIPDIYADVSEVFEQYYQERIDCAPFLKFRSWIGGDRDGNPFVTPDITRYTFDQHRQAVIELYYHEIVNLHHELSLSTRWLRQMDGASEISPDELYSEVDRMRYWRDRNEPFREKTMTLIQRLEKSIRYEDGGYTADEFLADVKDLRDSLMAAGFPDFAWHGRVGRLFTRAKVFGFHFVALDVRQHSGVHESTVAELFALAGISTEYEQLDEAQKMQLLEAELENPRPLLPKTAQLSDASRKTLDTFLAIAEALTSDAKSFGAYVISMTHDISDLFEVLILAKEAGLWHYENGEVHSRIDVSPLFETISDLKRAKPLLTELFSNEIYAKHLASRKQFQEIMLGYSDSNKDGGYWMANWALHQAQQEITEFCASKGITVQLFHGRGGTVGRGGGRANQAITALPETCHNGRIRFTEQGEVITFRYSIPEIAHRHLEQIMNAMIITTGKQRFRPSVTAVPEKKRVDIMHTIAEESMKKYRELVEHDDFWDWYNAATPMQHISKLRIASRPVSRSKSGKVDLGSIRAIPWNFGWTQTRYNVPGWYGMGEVLHTLVAQDESLRLLQHMYRDWTFFQAVLNNCQREMARAELGTARHYAGLAKEQHPDATNFDEVIQADFAKLRHAMLMITGQTELLDRVPVIKKSIRLRNPYTDVLNFIQVELMRRWNKAQGEEQEELGRALLLNINGLAAAMQSTG